MGEKYFVLKGEKQDGPYSLDELKHFHRAGVLKLDDLCAQDGDREWRPVRSVLPRLRGRKATPGLMLAGVALCVVSALCAFYFVAVFEVSVSSPMGRVVNLDLMSQRQNGVIISAALGVAGVACLIGNALRFKR